MSAVSALIISSLAAAGFLSSSLIALAGNRFGRRADSVAVALAAGVLLAVAFADLYPESLELAGESAIWGFAGGFALLLLIESLTRGHTHHLPGEHVHRHALTPFVLGLAIHNLADGFSLGITSELSVTAAIGVGTGVLVHQVPVGLSLAAVLLAADCPRRRTVAITVPLALVIPVVATVTALLPTPGDDLLGTLVGVAGGVLVYMGAAQLLPAAQREDHGRLPGITFAITLVFTTVLLLGVL